MTPAALKMALLVLLLQEIDVNDQEKKPNQMQQLQKALSRLKH